MVDENHIKEYLNMQHNSYQGRAAYAVMTAEGVRPETDGVIGNLSGQVKFPYDENIFKYFKGDPKECSVLEYGCGPGRNLLRMVNKFKLVAGCDISENNLSNLAKAMALNGKSNVMYIPTTGDRIPVDDNLFDVVFEVICMQHICSYTIRKRILTDMYRVCKPGGVVVCQLGFNNGNYPDYYVDYYADKLLGVKETNGASDCCVTDERQITNDFFEIGFTVEGVWHTDTVADVHHSSWIWICGRK